MNYSELFLTAVIALKTNVMRTALTMLGIVIGIASVILIIALAQGATSSITSSVSSLGSNLLIITPGTVQSGPSQSGENVTTLTYDDGEAIRKLPYVAAVSANVQKRYQVVGNGENTNVIVQGVSFEYPTVQSIEIDHGNFLEKENEENLSKVAVLGSTVVTSLFGEGAEPMGETITIDGKSFRIVGVMKSKGSSGFSNSDEMVYIPITTAMRTMIGQDYVNSIFVVADEVDKVSAANEEIQSLLTDRHDIAGGETTDFSITTSKQAQSTLTTITTTLTAMLAGIAGISLIVGGIGIMNIMMVTVTERTKEVGLLKSIGAKRKDILIQFLIEAIVLTLTGGIVGIIFGEVLAYLIANIISIPFVFQVQAILLALGVSTVVGVVFGVYPAQRAAKLSPIDALRYE